MFKRTERKIRCWIGLAINDHLAAHKHPTTVELTSAIRQAIEENQAADGFKHPLTVDEVKELIGRTLAEQVQHIEPQELKMVEGIDPEALERAFNRIAELQEEVNLLKKGKQTATQQVLGDDETSQRLTDLATSIEAAHKEIGALKHTKASAKSVATRLDQVEGGLRAAQQKLEALASQVVGKE